MAVIEIQSLSKAYNKHNALHDVNLNINAGQIVGVFGRNGCGKSTLLKVLGGLITVYQGKVFINGARPAMAETKKHISYLAEKPFLPDRYNAEACLNLYEQFYNDFDRAKAERYLQKFNIPNKQSMKKLSKGMVEKLHLAMIMGREADIYLLDEPISGIDPAARQDIMEELVSFYCPESVVIITSHLINELEAVIDTAVFLKDGEVVLSGAAEDLRLAHGKSLNELFMEVCR